MRVYTILLAAFCQVSAFGKYWITHRPLGEAEPNHNCEVIIMDSGPSWSHYQIGRGVFPRLRRALENIAIPQFSPEQAVANHAFITAIRLRPESWCPYEAYAQWLLHNGFWARSELIFLQWAIEEAERKNPKDPALRGMKKKEKRLIRDHSLELLPDAVAR